VRPFVTTDILLQNVRQALETGAADTCIPSADTLVHAPDRKAIASIPNRSEYLRGQTPQSFDYSLILRAHRETKRRDSSDDCQLVLDLGHPVSVVPGDEHNIKITSEMDLFLAEQLFRLRLQRGKCYRTASLKNQRFAIVGGSGGIGSAIAHRIEDLEGVAIALSRRTEPFHLDLRDPSSIQDVLRKIGPLDGLINCAGFLMVKSLEKLTPQEIEASIDVNLKGLILCCKMASLKKGAHVINIASSSFSRGRKDTSIYSSAKAAVVNFTQGWAEERPDLHIHALIPQRTNTAMRRQNFPNEEPQTLLDPKEVAEAAIDLLLEDELTGLMVEVRKDAFY
jgi:ribitol-5-phosphate 2-dehydrogenase (NADP+) / D-ribitol-5-phosphate cytidylyltransferase